MAHLAITRPFERVRIASRMRGPTTQHSLARTLSFVGIMRFDVNRDETVKISSRRTLDGSLQLLRVGSGDQASVQLRRSQPGGDFLTERFGRGFSCGDGHRFCWEGCRRPFRQSSV